MTKKLNSKIVTWRLFKEKPLYIFLALLASTLVSISSGASIYFFSKITDAVIANDVSEINKLSLITIIIGLVLVVSLLLHHMTMEIVCIKLKTLLRTKYSKNITNQNTKIYNSSSKGDHWDNLTSSLEEIMTGYFKSCIISYMALFTIISIFVSLALLNVYFAIFFLVALILSKLVIMLFDKKLREKTMEKAEKRKEYNAKLDDLGKGIETLFWNNNIDSFEKQLAASNNDIYKSSVAFEKADMKMKITTMLFESVTSQVIFLSFGLYALLVNHSLVGMFVAIVIAIGQMSEALRDGSQTLMKARKTKPLRENDLYFVSDNSFEVTNIAPATFKKNIVVQNLEFAYDEEQILKGIDFEINPGDKVAILGKSGAGKSTLMNLLLNQIQPTKGKIFIDGENMLQVNERAYLKNIAYANNKNLILSDTFKNNISIFGKQEVEFSKLQEIFNLDFIKTENDVLNFDEYSTGQKQRINLARVWANKKPILILDECFGNLDKRNANEILSKILEDETRTIILISHHLTAKQKSSFDKIINL